MSRIDAILVPGGGLAPDGKPTKWVQGRLDHAARRWSGQIIITLSAGTIHKRPPLDADGYPIFESVAGGKYLLQKGIPKERILYETSSYDTIGNAYFARAVHTDPLGARRLLVVTSEFHMPRTRAIFDWIFGLSISNYALEYETVADTGIDKESLDARIAKEREGLLEIPDLRSSISNMKELHEWLFSEHSAYALMRPAPSAGRASSTY